MRWVAEALTRPSRCAVLPYIGATHPDGFIDAGTEMHDGADPRFDQHVYVSVVAVREMGALIGLVDSTELTQRIADLEQEKEAMLAEVEEARATLNAVDLMESAGFTARKKAGRPPKQTVEA